MCSGTVPAYIGNWTCLCFLKMLHWSSKRLIQFEKTCGRFQVFNISGIFTYLQSCCVKHAGHLTPHQLVGCWSSLSQGVSHQGYMQCQDRQRATELKHLQPSTTKLELKEDLERELTCLQETKASLCTPVCRGLIRRSFILKQKTMDVTHKEQLRVQQWRMWASIPLPLTCEASALPFELIPRCKSGFCGKLWQPLQHVCVLS